MNERILRLPELIQLLGVSATSIWRKEQFGDFPKRFKIGIRNVGWLESSVQQWIKEQANKNMTGTKKDAK